MTLPAHVQKKVDALASQDYNPFFGKAQLEQVVEFAYGAGQHDGICYCSDAKCRKERKAAEARVNLEEPKHSSHRGELPCPVCDSGEDI